MPSFQIARGPTDPAHESADRRSRVRHLHAQLFGNARRVTYLLVGLASAAIVAVWSVVIERIEFERAETIAAVTKQNASLAGTLEEHTVRTLVGIDQALHFVRYQFLQQGLALDVRKAMTDGDIDESTLTDLAIIDEQGTRILGRDSSKRISVADREYFKFHQRPNSSGMFISEPTMGRVTGKWAIHMSLRINHPDGSFGGVALAAVDPAYFTKFYERAALGEHGLVTLVGLDGIARARQVDRKGSFGEDMRGSTLLAKQAESASGSFTSVGKLDGTRRFYSYRTLQRYPLIVAVGTSEAETLAPVSERARNYRLFATLATLCAIVFVGAALIALSRQRQAAAAIADTDVQFWGLAESMPQLVWICRPDGWSIYFNQRWTEYTGLSLDESYGHGWERPIHPDDKLRALAAWEHAIKTGEAFDMACRLRRADGAYPWFLMRSLPMRDSADTVVSWFGTCTDIDAQKQTEAALQESERFAHATIDALSKTIAVIDASGRILSVNRAWRDYASANGAIPAPVSEAGNYLDVCDKAAAGGDATAASVGELLRTIIRGEQQSAAMEYPTHASSEVRWFSLTLTRFPDDGPIRVIVSHEDITERKAHESHIEYLATHDALTDLPNRNLLNDRITQAINHAGRVDLELAILFVDLDNFKYVNDGFGHAVGDELLRVIALELRALVRSGDTVSRLGGDEFVLLLDDLKNAVVAATALSRKLLERFSRPFAVGAREFTVTGSIGISLYPGDGQDPDVLLMNADAAMYHAKEAGRNTFQFSAPEMKNKAIERVALEGALRRALQFEQFELHYQPQVLIATGEATGMEALVRWRHPELGLIMPAQFIPMAEETGLIIPIGEWVLRNACAQNKSWQDAGLPPLTVSVNLSSLQLRQVNLVDLVSRILGETGLDARYLDLELTETMVMAKSQATIDHLQALKALGIALSIDDFGTGYSNLGYLKSFPLDQLKIDRSFVHDLPESANAASIARAIVSMGHSLGLRVVAEGVETIAQAQFLASIHCEHAQGYLYAKPLPAKDFALWLTGRRTRSLNRDQEVVF